MLYGTRVGWSVALWASMLGGVLHAQNPASSPQTPPAGRGGAGRSAYPQRSPADPAVLERGKGFFTVNCGFCHGSDARGGEGGPNLLRTQMVLNDRNGEGIAQILQNGRPEAGMPKFSLSAEQVSEIAAFLHSLPVGGRDPARQTPVTILVGDAAAGKTYFGAKCASCHSATGDLKGLASRFANPMTLQQTWIMPNAGGRGGRGATAVNVPSTTVTVTTSAGQNVEGRLVRIDDFLVTLTDAQGKMWTFPRKGDQPPIVVHDPLEPHLNLLPQYTDKDIHNLTAYLVTLK